MLRLTACAVNFHVIEQQRGRNHGSWNSGIGCTEHGQSRSGKTRPLALREVKRCGIARQKELLFLTYIPI